MLATLSWRQPTDRPAEQTDAQQREFSGDYTMAAWPDRLEHFLDHYPHIIAAVEAISTFAAVVVALWLARRSEAVRLRALLSIALFPTDPSQVVTLQIHNMGLRTGALAPPPFFEWKIPFRRKRQPETMPRSRPTWSLSSLKELKMEGTWNSRLSDMPQWSAK